MIEILRRVFKKETTPSFIDYPIEKGSYKVVLLNGDFFFVDDKTIQHILNLRRVGERNLLLRDFDNKCSNIYDTNSIVRIYRMEEERDG